APVADENGRLIGIISERDIIRGLAEDGDSVLALPVDRLMTREDVTCSLEDPIVGMMEVMTNKRIRHLPRVHNGRLRSIASIAEVVKEGLAEANSSWNSCADTLPTADVGRMPAGWGMRIANSIRRTPPLRVTGYVIASH